MNDVAYIALGSNIGERYTYLTEAIQFLNKNPYIQVDDISSVYETEPVGYTDQSCFLNLVIKISTNLSPQELLKVTQKVENDLGRKREIRWGPRTLDLDILLYNHENIETEILSVPHPRMHERAFVIVPLMEVDPDIKLPQMYTPLSGLLEQIPDKEGVRLWKVKNGEGVFALFES